MTDIVIDKGVPVPPALPLEVGARGSLYPWADMEVGDSFAVPAKDEQDAKVGATQLMLLAHHPTRPRYREHWKFTARSFDDHARIWRIE